MTADQLWLGIGLLGQALFSARFLVQGLRRRAQAKRDPTPFWYFSIGSVSRCCPTRSTARPVFILGMCGCFHLRRNLYLSIIDLGGGLIIPWVPSYGPPKPSDARAPGFVGRSSKYSKGPPLDRVLVRYRGREGWMLRCYVVFRG